MIQRRSLGGLLLAVTVLAGCVSSSDMRVPDVPAVSRSEFVQVPGLIREPLPLTVTLADGNRFHLVAMVTRPDGPGRYPLALLSHGMATEWKYRKEETATEYAPVANMLAQRGWAVVTALRPGYGQSEGGLLESNGPCEDMNYAGQGKVMADELSAIVTAVTPQPWLDSDRILLVGHSGGGYASLALAASSALHIVGIVNFAGGSGAPADGTQFCQPDRLIQTLHDYGSTTHVPSLWVYAANDIRFPPQLAADMFKAYHSAGAPATMVAAPAYLDDGHDYILAVDRWHGDLDRFLAAKHLQVQAASAAPKTEPIKAPAAIRTDADRDLFERYLDAPLFEKAFAVGANGGVGYGLGYSSLPAAEAEALRKCGQKDSGCHIYAAGNQLAP
jgi:dienelactone hydrolase